MPNITPTASLSGRDFLIKHGEHYDIDEGDKRRSPQDDLRSGTNIGEASRESRDDVEVWLNRCSEYARPSAPLGRTSYQTTMYSVSSLQEDGSVQSGAGREDVSQV